MKAGIETVGVEQLYDSIGNMPMLLQKELGIVLWKTGRRCESIIARRIYKELHTTQKVIKKGIVVKRGRGNVTVQLAKTKRLNLKDFKPRQNGTGVSAKIIRSKGTTTIKSGFMGPKPGALKTSWKGQAFKREGKEKLPIVKLKGPSPWGVFIHNNMLPLTVEETQQELNKQLRERIRWNNLKRMKGLY